MKRYKCFGMVGPRMVEDANGDFVKYTPLLTAAPEMLEALEAIVATNPHNAPMTHEQIRSAYAESLRNARAAVAKAKGEQP